MEPSFRAFVSVELPFRVTPSRTTHLTTVTGAEPSAPTRSAPCLSTLQARAVTAFVPVAFAHDALGKSDAGLGETAATEQEEEERERENGRDSEGHTQQTRTTREKRPRAPVLTVTGEHTVNEVVPDEEEDVAAMERLYHVAPICRRGVSTQWESHSGDSEALTSSDTRRLWSYAGNPDDLQARAAWEADRRRDVFASVEPQLLQEGYLRNDLLLRITRRRRVRRWRNAETGALVREEALPWEETTADPTRPVRSSSTEPSSSSLSNPLDVRVLGVVSRELLLRRPADFAFAAVTPDEAHRAPRVHHMDSFAPGQFLSHRVPFGVAYVPGRDANTSVLAHQARLAQLGHADPVQRALLAETGYISTARPGDVKEEQGESTRDGAVVGLGSADMRDRLLTTLYADPTDLDHFPPAQSEEQREQLRLMGSSVDGHDTANDPPEVLTVVRLLAARPMWQMADLCAAMLHSGQCPVDHTNRRVIHALTYVVGQGPFNRVRTRIGYDPFHDARVNVRYQLIPLRIMRRSELGVLLRDVSRSAYVGQALQVIRQRHKEAQAAYRNAHSGDFRGTMMDRLCLMIEHGYLTQFVQIIDLLDDASIAAIVDAVPARAVLSVAERSQRHGWLDSDAQYTHIVMHMTVRLEHMLKDDVVPLLRFYEESASTSAAGVASVAPDHARTDELQSRASSASSSSAASRDGAESSVGSLSAAVSGVDEDGDRGSSFASSSDFDNEAEGLREGDGEEDEDVTTDPDDVVSD